MFGVPPGVLWDPADGAPAGPMRGGGRAGAPSTQRWRSGEAPHGAPGPGGGLGRGHRDRPRGARRPGARSSEPRRVAGRGLEGDRYAAGTAPSRRGGDGRALTLIEGEVLDELGLAPADARRNVVTRGIRLNPLMGHVFTVGASECAGPAPLRALLRTWSG